jgi:hypothetical protein
VSPALSMLLLSNSASTRSTVGSEKGDEPKGPTRPAASAADASGSAEDAAQVAIGALCALVVVLCEEGCPGVRLLRVRSGVDCVFMHELKGERAGM